MLKISALAGAVLLAASQSCFAGWSIDGTQSSLSFVSIKKSSVAETHHFTQLSGDLSDTGNLDVTIDLASVETAIPIRNERMQEHLFEVAKYPSATASAKLDMAQLSALPVGTTVTQDMAFVLTLHGKSKPMIASVSITKLKADSLLATTVKPVLVNAADFALVPGIEKLRELAGLPVIATNVPVTFSLQLTPSTQ